MNGETTRLVTSLAKRRYTFGPISLAKFKSGADELRYKLATYLHAHHSRTAHPPKPTAVA